MMGLFRYEANLRIRRLSLEREINYELFDDTGYMCRLVPGYDGFELSKLDRSLGLEISPQIIRIVTDYILNNDA